MTLLEVNRRLTTRFRQNYDFWIVATIAIALDVFIVGFIFGYLFHKVISAH